MLQNLLVQILAGIAGLWVAQEFLSDVTFTGTLATLAYAGVLLGLANAILYPILNLITFPIRILTLGLSSLVINVMFVWTIHLIFPEITIDGLMALLGTTVAVWLMGMVSSLILRKDS